MIMIIKKEERRRQEGMAMFLLGIQTHNMPNG